MSGDMTSYPVVRPVGSIIWYENEFGEKYSGHDVSR